MSKATLKATKDDKKGDGGIHKSVTAPVLSPKAAAVDAEKRGQIAKEILSTEESYTKGLENIVKLYLEPLNQAVASGKPILSASEIKTVFVNIEMIYRFHVQFLQELSVIKSWNGTQCIGSIFLKNSDFLMAYTPYVNGYADSAFLCAKKEKADKGYAAFVKGAKEKTLSRLDLASLLIMPIQRVPRYRLLLEDFVKHTPPTHPDYADLASALEKVKVIAEAINEKKKKAEMIQKVTEIQAAFDDDLDLVLPHRVFVSEGKIMYYVKRDSAGESLQYYLFNDILMLATSGKKLKLKESLDLVNTEIKDVMDTTAIKFAFELITLKTNYLLALPNLKAKEEFIKDFYLQRAKAAALMSAPKLAVEVVKSDQISGRGSSPGGSAILDKEERERRDRERRDEREREDKERRERNERDRLEREERDRRDREDRERREREERAWREEMQRKAEEELARTREELARVKLANAAPAAASAGKAAPTPVKAAAPREGVKVEDACFGCGEELEGKLMRVGQLRWHKRCFKCCRCRGPVPDEFNTADGKPICDNCFGEEMATKCPGCQKPILDRFIKALGKEWHKECFVCTKCKKPFPGGEFEIEGGMPYHGSC